MQAESLQLYQKETMEHVFSCEFCEFFKSTYIAKHLEMVASVYYQANINIRKSLLTYSKFKYIVLISKDCTTSLSHPPRFLGLSAQYNEVLFCAIDDFKPLTFTFFMYSNSVFLRHSLVLLPVTTVLSTFLGHASRSIHCRWPYQQRCPCLSIFSMPHISTLLC